MPVLTSLAKLRDLSRSEQTFLIGACLAPPLVWVRMHLFGFAATQRWLARSRPEPSLTPSVGEVARLAALLQVANRYCPVPSTCLTKSLALVWLLQRRAIASQLRIGVRLAKHKLEAHAWVEYDGVPINDRPDIQLQFATFADPLPLRAFSSR